MDVEHRPTAPEPSEAARGLGAELKRLRLSQTSGDGSAWTQQQMASAVYLGNKSAVSLYESGRRIPSAATLELYAEVCSCDAGALLEMRALARSGGERRAVPEPTPLRSSARRLRRWHLMVAAAAVLLITGGVVAAAVQHSGSTSHVVVVLPTTETDVTTSVDGTVTGLDDDDLWLDVQAESGDRHHPTDQPCVRSGSSFHYGTLYVGTPSDSGRMFRISVVATRKGSAAEDALVRYADRPMDVAEPYRGLASLPDGARVVTSTLVRRR